MSASRPPAPGPATTPLPIRPAVSVIVLRDGARGSEVFVQHRVATMDFAAGAVVFPGGRVDPVDYEAAAGCRREPANAMGRDGDRVRINRPGAWERGDMATTPDHAAVLVATALREVQEETGALLSADRLFPWANWVTPQGPPKRFDTYFFVTTADGLGELRNTTTEARRSEWLPIPVLLNRGTLAGDAQGALKLMRPTRTLLEELQVLGTASAVMAEARARTIVPVRNDRPAG